MQIGIVICGGITVGTVSLTTGDATPDTFSPNFEGYEPMGRADAPGNSNVGHTSHHHGNSDHSPARHRATHGGNHAPLSDVPSTKNPFGPMPAGHAAPSGREYEPSTRSAPFHQGSAETDAAIARAAVDHHLDPNFMRSIASIESSMNPSSNANRSTQYKGLYQVGHDGWRRAGQGNIYSAKDNAQATGRLWDENRSQFRHRFGRDPTETEIYLMHQQGLGFYTRGAMTNIGGNPYPGMRGPQTHDSFEAGWGREIARRKAQFAERNQTVANAPSFDPGTMVP